MVGSLAASVGAALLALVVPTTFSGPPKSVTRVDKTWVCNGPVDLDTVTVTMTPASVGARSNEDAVHLQSGCTGRIGRIAVTQSAGDGIKVAEGVHDLTIAGGFVRCLAKAPVLHQDGIQVMGGTRITFQGLDIDCGRPGSRLINSNLFIKEAGKSTTPPTDVVCADCTFGGWAAHTVSVQSSVRSGVTGSSLCYARFPQLTLSIGPDAVDPVGGGNTLRQCGPGRLTIGASTRIAKYGEPVLLSGLFLAQALGSPVTLEGRTFDGKTWKPLATVHTGKTSKWKLAIRPGVQTTYRARLGTVVSPSAVIRVQPTVVLTRLNGRYLAQVYARRSFRGRTVMLQRLAKGAWTDVAPIVLGPQSKKVFSYPLQGAASSLRLTLAAAPGYLPAVSAPLLVS
jgi:hypothetical protein